MELQLFRTYTLGKGTNGDLWLDDKFICHTIELPWKNNEPTISCIEEGIYSVVRCYSKKFGWHFSLKNVSGRKFILIHPANNAQEELRGCIAPVTKLLSPGIGSDSKKAMDQLTGLVFPVLKKGEPVYLIIKPNLSTNYECSTTGESTHPEVL